MSRGSAPRHHVSRAPTIDLAVAASLWGGLYVISAATFEAIPPATLTLIRLALGVAVLLALGYYMLTVSVTWLDRHPVYRPDLLFWLPNAIFLILGAWLFLRIERPAAR